MAAASRRRRTGAARHRRRAEADARPDVPRAPGRHRHRGVRLRRPGARRTARHRGAEPVSDLSRWTPREPPSRTAMHGRYVTLRPLSPDDADALWECSRDESVWAYLSY